MTSSTEMREALASRWPDSEYLVIPEAPEDAARQGRKIDLLVISLWGSRECTHGMPSPASCVECMEVGNLPPTRPVETSHGSRVAEFESRCSSCAWLILAGERIGLDATGQWVHEDCVA